MSKDPRNTIIGLVRTKNDTLLRSEETGPENMHPTEADIADIADIIVFQALGLIFYFEHFGCAQAMTNSRCVVGKKTDRELD